MAAVNTTLIDGITLPSIPTTTYRLGDVVWSGSGSNTIYLVKQDANGNGIMQASAAYYSSTSAVRTWANGADGSNDGSASTSGATWDASGIFLGSTGYTTSGQDTYVNFARRGNLRTNRTFAYRFTGCSGISALVKSNGNTDAGAAYLAVYELGDGDTQTSVGTAKSITRALDVITVEGLNTTKTYVAYLYGANASNGELYEIAFLGASTPTHSVTYDLNGGTGTVPTQPNVKEGSSFTLASAEGITAPTNLFFGGWNDGSTVYAPGSSYTMSTNDVVLTASWTQRITLIDAVLNGGTSAPTVTGTYAGSTVAKTQGTADAGGGYKFGSAGHYVGLTLADGQTFKKGDVLHVNVTTQCSSSSKLALYSDLGTSLICATEIGQGTGDLTFTLTDAFNGLSTFYLYRSDAYGWNGYVASVSVVRESSTDPEGPELDPESTELIYDAAYSGSTVTVAETLTKQGSFNGHNSFKFSFNAGATFSAPGKIITGIKITSYNYPADEKATYTVASTKDGSTAEVITPANNTVTSSDSNNPEEVLFIINDAEANESFKLQMAGWFDAFSYFTVYYKDGPVVEQTILSMSIDGLNLNASQITELNTNSTITLSATTDASDVVVALSDGSAATITGKGTNQITINDKWTINLTKHVYNAETGDKQSTIIPAQPYYSTPSTDGVFSVNIGGDARFKINPGTYTITAPSNVIIKQVTFNNITENYDGDANSTIAVTATTGTVNAPFFNVLDRTGRVLKFTVDGAEPGASVSFTIGGSKQKAFGNLIIDYAEAAATTPPVVLSTSVTNSEHKNHATVTITFDHSVAAATATVGGNNCRIQGLGTPTLKIGAWNLPWNATSTVTLPAGSVRDASGNATTEDITVDITVGSQQDYIITDFDYTVSNITELKAALDATKNNGNDRKTIFLKNGTYNANDLATGSSASEIQACQLSVGKNVSLIGESLDGVTIIYTPSAEGMGERTVTLNDGDYAQDITFRTGIEVGGGRGVALYTQGKHIILNNCRALGGQDTYLTGGSCYWKGGEISGSTDFIFGSGNCLFDGTTISTYGGPITAGNHSANTEWGYVFKGCTIQAARSGVNDGGYELGRTWQGEPRVAFIDTDMKITPTANAWGPMGDASNTWLYEYNSTKNGVAVDLSNRFCSDSNNQTTKGTDYTLTDAQAAEFTMENIFGEVDGWYPAEEIPVIMVTPESATLNANGYATFASTKEITISGASAYTGKVDEEAKTITWTKIADNIIPANEGVLLRGDAGAEVTFTVSATGKENIAGNDMLPNLVKKTKAELGEFIYVLSGGDIMRLSETGSLKANRAYFSLSKYVTEGSAQAAKFTSIFVDDNTTANNVVKTNVAAKTDGKFLKNGEIMIIRNGKVYNAVGAEIQ